jgi:hypothetical protein
MDQARALLSHIPTLGRPSDLDLLMFFARHPRTLLSIERLAGLLGYGLDETARSLEVLLRAQLLRRTGNRTGSLQMYLFTAEAVRAAWLPALVEFGSSREGRLALRRALIQCPTPRQDDEPDERTRPDTAAPGAEPVMMRTRSGARSYPDSDAEQRGTE